MAWTGRELTKIMTYSAKDSAEKTGFTIMNGGPATIEWKLFGCTLRHIKTDRDSKRGTGDETGDDDDDDDDAVFTLLRKERVDPGDGGGGGRDLETE